jgi:hypothetical protein
MKISFELIDVPGATLRFEDAMTAVGKLYYQAYFANIEIESDGRVERLASIPMVFFLSAVESLMIEAFLTNRAARIEMWDTGLTMTLSFLTDDGSIVLEIPEGSAPLRYHTREFLPAVRAMALNFMRELHEENPRLFSQLEGSFEKGSVLHRIVQMVLSKPAAPAP